MYVFIGIYGHGVSCVGHSHTHTHAHIHLSVAADPFLRVQSLCPAAVVLAHDNAHCTHASFNRMDFKNAADTQRPADELNERTGQMAAALDKV